MYCLAVPKLRRKHFQHLAFMIDRAPLVTRLAFDPNKHFVQVPTPKRERSAIKAPHSDLSSKHRAKPVPPISHCLITQIDATLVQKILYLAQRK